MVFSTDKAYTHTDHIQTPAEAMGANVSPLFQSSLPDIIHSPRLCLSVFLCHSDALRCVRSYIHHLCRTSVLYLIHIHTHAQACITFVPFYQKNWGIWWLNDPMHPLSLSSRYHIHFMLSSLRALPKRQPLRLTVSSLWLCYHISRDKYKGWGCMAFIIPCCFRWANDSHYTLHSPSFHNRERWKLLNIIMLLKSPEITEVLDALMCGERDEDVLDHLLW